MILRSEKDLMLFYFGYKSFINAADELIQSYGIGRQHHRFLFFICYYPGIHVSALLEILEISKQGAQSALKVLKTRGLIIEKTNQNDKRLKELHPTEAGLSLIESLCNAQLQLLNEVESEYGPNWTEMMKGLSAPRPGYQMIKEKRGIAWKK